MSLDDLALGDTEKTIINFIESHDEKIANVKDHVWTVFDQSLEEFNSVEDFKGHLRIAGSSEFKDQELRRRFADTIYSAAVNENDELLVGLKEAGVSDEIVSFVANLKITYTEPAQFLSVRGRDGPDYWKRLKTDFVFERHDGYPGMNYRLSKRDEEIRLSVSSNSNMTLVRYLLNAQVRLLDIVDEEKINITQQQLEEVESAVSELEERLEFDDGGQ